MQGDCTRLALGVTLAAIMWPTAVLAQTSTTDELMAMNKSALKGEIGTRYDAALALTKDAGVVSADSAQFMWASQAKAQCGIALGFLKSGTKDPVSIGKCNDAYNRMQGAAMMPPAPPAPPAPAMAACAAGPYIVFFDWDQAVVTPEAVTTLDSTVANFATCSYASITVAGYTDTSGSPRYNQGLSERRAAAVRDYLAGHGVNGSAIETQGFGESNLRVPTADGVRELQNRRVEITVK